MFILYIFLYTYYTSYLLVLRKNDRIILDPCGGFLRLISLTTRRWRRWANRWRRNPQAQDVYYSQSDTSFMICSSFPWLVPTFHLFLIINIMHFLSSSLGYGDSRTDYVWGFFVYRDFLGTEDYIIYYLLPHDFMNLDSLVILIHISYYFNIIIICTLEIIILSFYLLFKFPFLI